MADLLVSSDDTDRPWHRDLSDSDGSPRGAAADQRGAAPDAALEQSGELVPQTGGIALADVPEWVVERVDRVTYPTRMARRRAIEAAQTSNTWQPDPWITPPVLNQLEDELSRVLGRRYEPLAPAEPAVEPEPVEPEAVEPEAVEPEESTQPIRTDPPVPAHRTSPGLPDLLPSVARSQRGARRRSKRRRVVAVAMATVAAVATLAGSIVVVTHGGGDSGQDAAATSAAPTQQVVALGLASGGQLTGISLLASGPGGAEQVLVPSQLLLDVPGAGRMPVSRSLAPGASAPGAAVADALDIRVAGTWVLDSSALATLVDSVGGVTVDVDVDVAKGPAEGAAIIVSAGPHVKLNGSQAAAYAQLLVGDEPEASRLARQERVVTALLTALPQDDNQRRAFLVGLPNAPKADVLQAVLAVTGGLREAAASDALPSTVLPVRDIDTGGDVTAYGLDDAAAAKLVSARLAGAAIPVPAGGRLTVLVQNGNGAPGLGDSARSKLVAAGLKYMGGGNVDGFGVAQTVVLIPDSSSEQRAKGLSVARALGLSDSALRISDSSPSVADLVVILGADFRRD
ncbi:LCP family protein [Angustibacter sp. McL0619]|uniref:LCP family glycopolymer transferase n=1 Tax=Angustibacter sp. McL0619 TaxID=3415676 RepID=UPI003CE85FEB